MMYVDFTAGSKSYRLRLSTRNTVMLEKQLGCNPLSVFGNGDTLPTVTQMVNILYASMLQYEHGISLNDAYDIFDEWLADGHTMTDFIPMILQIYKASGLIQSDGTEEAGKN